MPQEAHDFSREECQIFKEQIVALSNPLKGHYRATQSFIPRLNPWASSQQEFVKQELLLNKIDLTDIICTNFTLCRTH